VIEGHTTIGRDNRIFQFASLGAIPQDKKYAGEPCELVIGDRNTIREFCTFNIGSRATAASPGGRRQLDHGLCAPGARLRGGQQHHLRQQHAAGRPREVGDWVILGGFTVVHQFVRIGAHSDDGHVLAAVRRGFAAVCHGSGPAGRGAVHELRGPAAPRLFADRIAAVKAMHKALYRDDLTLDQARARIAALAQATPEAAADVP
jgi:UDP-N-acetylglucosamine acyltransferase